MSGPQQERSAYKKEQSVIQMDRSTISQSPAHSVYDYQFKRDQTYRQFNEDPQLKDYLQNEANAAKNREVQIQQEHIRKLTLELQKAQTALGTDVMPISDLDQGLPPWAVNAIRLSPLSMAYENRIKELEDELYFAKKAKDETIQDAQRIIKENDDIRAEMEKR